MNQMTAWELEQEKAQLSAIIQKMGETDVITIGEMISVIEGDFDSGSTYNVLDRLVKATDIVNIRCTLDIMEYMEKSHE